MVALGRRRIVELMAGQTSGFVVQSECIPARFADGDRRNIQIRVLQCHWSEGHVLGCFESDLVAPVRSLSPQTDLRKNGSPECRRRHQQSPPHWDS